jgi:phosphoserine phosphatase RsbU/P
VATQLSPPPQSEDKLRDIRSITDAALSHLGADEFLTALLSRVKESLDADTAAVLLLDRSARQLIATAASGLEEEVRQGVRLPVGQGFAGRIAAEARPIILDHVDHGNVLNPILLEKGIRSLIGVPLLVNGAVIGVLDVGSVGSRVFTGGNTGSPSPKPRSAAPAPHRSPAARTPRWPRPGRRPAPPPTP